MKRTAFSLAEVLIATGILGVGLIMVASIFPVAIVQHREAADIAAASTLAQRARAMLLARVNIDDNGLYRPIRLGQWPGNSPYQPTPWMAIPIQSLIPAANSPPDGRYENLPNGGVFPTYASYENILSRWPLNPPVPNVPDTVTMFSARDLVSDLRPPQNDTEAEAVASRLVWYPFYREISASDVEFCVAVCRQTRGAIFGLQDTTLANPTLTPTISVGNERRFPVPWRVTVYRWGERRLSNETVGAVAFGGADLGRMCPVGSKLMLTGGSSSSQYPVPSGRVLTVTEVIAENTRQIDVAEDISDIPFVNSAVPPVTFDIWVFPPQLGNGQLEFAKSPVLEWFHF